MDEWDEFLTKANEPQSSVPVSDIYLDKDADLNPDIIMDMNDSNVESNRVLVSQTQTVMQDSVDLGKFGDNAEVLMQMARGESLSQLSSGIWLNSCVTHKSTLNNLKGSYDETTKKRALKSITVSPPSIPIANSLQDLLRALIGNPLLSYPLSQLKLQNFNLQLNMLQNVSAYEVDSLGLFFYGAPGTVKIESNVQDDMKKGLEMKKLLLNFNLLQIPIPFPSNSITNKVEIQNDEFSIPTPYPFTISYENFKTISNSIPPQGKSNWLIPFTVYQSNTSSDSIIDISKPAIVHDFCSSDLSLFFEFCSLAISSAISNSDVLFNEETEHLITIDEEFKFLVKTKAPACTVAVNFRGAQYTNPFQESVSSLFYRQSNYSFEIDFESLCITSLKSFVPKFDEQSRSFMLLKALQTKLSKLEPGEYFLAHIANTPFIKIITFKHNSTDDSLILLNNYNLDSFLRNK